MNRLIRAARALTDEVMDGDGDGSQEGILCAAVDVAIEAIEKRQARCQHDHVEWALSAHYCPGCGKRLRDD